jgi:ribonuclease P protein component
VALPRNNRIVEDKDFSKVFKEGKTVHGSFFFIKGRKNDTLEKRRFSVIVRGKVVKSAVGRNKIKRGIIEVVRQNPRAGIGYDIACYIREDCLKDLRGAQDEFLKALKKLSI